MTPAAAVVLLSQLWAIPIAASAILVTVSLPEIVRRIEAVASISVRDIASAASALQAMRHVLPPALVAGIGFALWWLFWSGIILPIVWPSVISSVIAGVKFKALLDLPSHWRFAMTGGRDFTLLIRDGYARAAMSLLLLSVFPVVIAVGGLPMRAVVLLSAALVALLHFSYLSLRHTSHLVGRQAPPRIPASRFLPDKAQYLKKTQFVLCTFLSLSFLLVPALILTVSG